MVNIIIPAYNAHETIRQAIASICVQENQKEIKVTIVDDFSATPYDYLLQDYKYININLLHKPLNSGCGQTRQYGIDNTDCEYFMFLDADDLFYSPDAVKVLSAVIQDQNADVITSSFLQEMPDNNAIVHRNEFSWMHGKIYRTQYIKERNIRFNKTRANEDSAYNSIILNTGAKIQSIENITYIWKNNNKSLTRSGDYLTNSISDFIINAEYALNESIRLNAEYGRLRDCIYKYLITLYGYYIFFLSELNEKRNPKFIEEYFSNVKRYYKSIPDKFIENIYDGYINTMFYNNTAIKNMIIGNNLLMNIPFFNFLWELCVKCVSS